MREKVEAGERKGISLYSQNCIYELLNLLKMKNTKNLKINLL